jgi:hypothetical protein
MVRQNEGLGVNMKSACTFKRTRWLLMVVLVLSFCISGQAAKKMLEWGIDCPDTVWVRDNIANMEQAPFDGAVFYVTSDPCRTAGQPGDFSWQCFGTKQFTQAELQANIDALAATTFTKFTDNFIRVNVTPGNVDWFDDTNMNKIIANMGLAAKIAKDGHIKGIMFDTEYYQGRLWDYQSQTLKATKTYAQYAAKVRERGVAIMNAFQANYPGITVIFPDGYTGPWRDCYPFPYTPGPGHYAAFSNDPNKLAWVALGLSAPFMDGMLSAATGSTTLIDGCEGTYTTSDFTTPQNWRQGFTTDVLPLVGSDVRTKYSQVFKQALATWMDANHHIPGGWSSLDFTNNFWQPDELETVIRAGLTTSDTYHWLYTESMYWWGPSVHPPKAYWNAVARAHAMLVPPASCQEAINIGFKQQGDLNNDCLVTLKDFALVAAGWLQCVEPSNSNCSKPWQ